MVLLIELAPSKVLALKCAYLIHVVCLALSIAYTEDE